jgi:signal peptidase I
MNLLKHKKTAAHSGKKRPLKELGVFIIDILYNAAIIIVLVVLIRTFLISPFRVIGSSMADTLSNNEFILIDKLSYRLGEPKRGDPIVFLPPITNKYPHKFEESVTTDGNGAGALDISNLSKSKQAFYCQSFLVKHLWFCEDKVSENDLVYYRLVNDNSGDGSIDLSWKQASKQTVTADDIKQNKITIKGQPNETYLLRIYDSTGPEYFVKRIIGIPGDTIHIENGRVYLKKPGETDFKELDEPYLNEENRYHTYYQKASGYDDFTVPKGYYFALGDNRNHSNDSRQWFSPIDEELTPYVKAQDISGRVLVVLWPPQDMRILPAGLLMN